MPSDDACASATGRIPDPGSGPGQTSGGPNWRAPRWHRARAALRPDASQGRAHAGVASCLVHAHTRARTHARTQTHTPHARTHARTHALTHARTHARTHTRTHPRAHTHTPGHGLRSPGKTATQSRSGFFAFGNRVRSSALCRIASGATESRRRRFRASGATRSKMHRACFCGTGPQRRRPIISDPIACTHRRPSARPAQTRPPATALCASGPAQSTQHHPCTASVRRQSLTAQLPADERSVPRRSSDVSCVILPRLGASDAVPASPIQLTARTAAPRLAPRRSPTTSYSPARNCPSQQHATSSTHYRRSQAPAHSAAARRCTQRTAEVQRRPLRHR